MVNWSRGQLYALTLVLAILGAGLAVKFVHNGRAAEREFVITGDPITSTPVPVPAQNTAVPTDPPPTEVVVHVAGAVKRAGVYRLSVGARADDAIRAAGGPTAKANVDAINLAARLEDGQQLYVPMRDEQPVGSIATNSSPIAHGAAKPPSRNAHTGSGKLTSPGQGTVNLNTANAVELQRLSGVGPAMAARILDYRKQVGGFKSPEQLMDVSGIGEKKFAKMQPFVRVR